MKKIIQVLVISLFLAASLNAQNQCELFTIKNYTFYSPKIYDYPIIFQKGSNQLIQNSYIPVWYPGYCAINRPSYFATKSEYLTYVHSSQIDKFSQPYFDNLYETNKNDAQGIKRFFASDYHLLFRGTINVKNLASGKEYLLVAGGDYISNESDYNKNTKFYDCNIKTMMAFALENGLYKLVDIKTIFGDFSNDEYAKVNNILNAKTLLSAPCFENINNLNKSNFNNAILPSWIIDKTR